MLGILHTFQPFLPAMRAARAGKLVGMASVAGFRGLPGAGAYSASKAAAINYLEALRVEMVGSGVEVITICPGYVKTPLVDRQIADQAKAHGISEANVVRDVLLVHQPRKEFVRVDELAALAVFLASDAAASMTATAIAMDGGWTQH